MKCPTDYISPSRSEVVPAGGTAVLMFRPESGLPFAFKRFFIGAPSLAAIEVERIRVNNRDYLIDNTRIPAQLFNDLFLARQLSREIVILSAESFEITVRNTGATSQRVFASLTGQQQDLGLFTRAYQQPEFIYGSVELADGATGFIEPIAPSRLVQLNRYLVGTTAGAARVTFKVGNETVREEVYVDMARTELLYAPLPQPIVIQQRERLRITAENDAGATNLVAFIGEQLPDGIEESDTRVVLPGPTVPGAIAPNIMPTPRPRPAPTPMKPVTA